VNLRAIPLASQTDLAGFHDEATRLLALQVAPPTIGWHAPAAAVPEPRDVATAASPQVRTRAARAIVPQSFVRLSELVVLHRDEGRFDLLYRALWRLVHEPELRHDPADADLMRLRQMAHAVRRDITKMKARVAFRPLELKGRALMFAWYEPTHHVCELVAASIAKRQPAATWLLLTPDRALRWEDGRLLSAPPLEATQTPPPSAPDAVWQRVLEEQAWA